MKPEKESKPSVKSDDKHQKSHKGLTDRELTEKYEAGKTNFSKVLKPVHK